MGPRTTALVRLLGAASGAAAVRLDAARCEAEEAVVQKKESRWDATVDWIVVGAGSSGCAVASRLAKAFPKERTLLIEAGDNDNVEEIQNAVDYFGKAEKVFGSERDWSYHAEAQQELVGRAIYWPRGKVVGGCSSFNTMVFLRGDAMDFDFWAKLTGFPEWGYTGMLPFFKRVESHPGHKSVHGFDGPISVAPLSHNSHVQGGAEHQVTRVFVQAAQLLGIRKNDDFALNGNDGAGVNDVNAKSGRRCNAAAYLKLVGAYPTGLSAVSSSPQDALHVWLCSQTTRIIFDDDKRAIGLEVKLNGPAEDLGGSSSSDPMTRLLNGKQISAGEDGKVRIRVKNDIILSCGAVDSPRLLLLSGVGPKEHLRDVKIPIVADLPGVGSFLKDHMHVPICYRIPGGVKPHSHSNICEGTVFTTVAPETKSDNFRSDLQIHCGTLFFEPDGFSPLGEGFTLTPSLIHPRSSGTLRLVSSDPEDRPVIHAEYLTNPYDLDVLVRGVKLTRKLGEEMLRILGGGEEHFPGEKVSTDEEIEAYVRKFVGSMYHPACSVKIGAEDDPMAVLDRKLRVRGGVKGVRVIDASIMPEIIGANTNATCLAIGEKGAQIIIDDHILGAIQKSKES